MASYETLVEGPDLTVVAWHCDCRDPALGPWEEVGSHEVVIPLAGMFVQHREGGREIPATPGVVLPARRGEGYRVRHPAESGDRGVALLVSDAPLEDLARTEAPTGLAATPLLDPHLDRRLAPGIFLWLRALEARGWVADPLEVEEAAGLALASLIGQERRRTVGSGRTAASGRTRARHRRAVERAIEFIACNYGRRLSLERIAAVAAYSPFHFARIFRRYSGMGIHEFVVDLRLRAALSRILLGERNISAAALSAGFSSHSHFTAAFRRKFGLAPSAARQLDERSRRELTRRP